ncbi:hypothetical protein Pla163_12240 [Planctomycetes bacterium Pla163]|uniref:Uncharacterized protein n=1 Tax=Rohdeia mirabilis TaxID=2528008 RepID=A0A518CY31_9BACT|nr:hypothetical protein Pla163_12240 [Planctomycetes bacterium Pla163]
MQIPSDERDGPERWPLVTLAPTRLLAWPRWERPDALERLVAVLEPAIRDGFAAVVLRFDPEEDGLHLDSDTALERFFAACADAFGDPSAIEALVVDVPLVRGELRSLAAAVDGLVDVGDRDALELARIGLAPLRTAAEVATWRTRHGEPGSLAPCLRAALCELVEGTALWLGGPDERTARDLAASLEGVIGDDARLVVAAPGRAAREARGVLLSSSLAPVIDWIDLDAVSLARAWTEPLELLVLDGSRGLPPLRRALDAWRSHLALGANVALVNDGGEGRELLLTEGLRLRSTDRGAAVFAAPERPDARLAR